MATARPLYSYELEATGNCHVLLKFIAYFIVWNYQRKVFAMAGLQVFAVLPTAKKLPRAFASRTKNNGQNIAIFLNRGLM
jgi:hypothetical protein